MAESEETPNRKSPQDSFTYRRGTWWPLWALFIVPFLFVFLPLYRFIKNEVQWKAAWLTVLVCEIVLFSGEYYDLKRGHWVYNEARIFGPKILGVPIEEPLLYYLFCPLIIICIFHLCRYILKKK